MKICILTPRFPFPENGGDVLRINSIARYFKFKGYELILLSFAPKKIVLKREYYDLYDEICIITHSKIKAVFYSFIALLSGKPIQCGYYFSSKFTKELKKIELQKKTDLYVSHLLRTGQYLEKLKFHNKSIIEMTDALSKTYTLSKNSKEFNLKKLIYKIEKKRICKYEKKVINEFPKVVLVSESDINFLREQNKIKGESLICYTNGVNCVNKINKNYDKNTICFLGNMRTLQNQDAVMFFVKEIFPIIKTKVPNATFKIIGAEPSNQIMNLADDKNIIVTGFVEDLESEILKCCVSVAPIRIAAGIQNKVLTSMACGIPIVLTSLISSAIPELISEKNCIIANTCQEISNAIVKILLDENYRNSIAQEGYKMVKEKYSWNVKLLGYENLIPPPTRQINSNIFMQSSYLRRIA